MPTTYTNQADDQFKRATVEIGPDEGVYIAGIKVVDGLVASVSVKSVNVVGGGGTDYGYATGSFGNDADYFETLTTSEFITGS